MFAPFTQFLPLITVRRYRVLPVPGEVLVRKGQAVRAHDTIASANLAARHYLLNVAKGLGVSEDQAEKHIERFVGNEISAGDIVATRSGFGKRIVRSPVDGTIVLISGGQVLIRLKTSPYELKAGYPGIVTELIHERGAVITSTGGLVQGVWGNGKINMGTLTGAATSPAQPLAPEDIHIGQRGAVLFAGYCDQPDALKASAEHRLRGLILASMAANLIPVAAAAPYPIVVLHGFGPTPFHPAALKLLNSSQQREVALIAERFDPSAGTRPEVFFPTGTVDELSDAAPALEEARLAPGVRVGITRAPHRGKSARIETILPGFSLLSNGLRAPAAQVSLAGGEIAQIPLANLEILIYKE